MSAYIKTMLKYEICSSPVRNYWRSWNMKHVLSLCRSVLCCTLCYVYIVEVVHNV
jgi:hypothetical protein